MRLSLDLGLGSVATMNAGGGYSAEAAALLARFTTPPTSTRKALINDLIVSLKDADVWSKLDTLYVVAAGDAQASRQNWKSDTFNLAPANAPTFTADRGYTGDGASSYLNTGFQPGVSSGNAAQNSIFQGLWCLTESVAAVVEMGNTNNSLGLRSNTGNFGVRSMLATSVGTALATSVGWFASSRNGATTWRSARNGVLLEAKTDTSIAPAAADVYLLGRNNAGTLSTPSARQIAAAAMGGYLTEAEDLSLYTALLTYLQAVGASA